MSPARRRTARRRRVNAGPAKKKRVESDYAPEYSYRDGVLFGLCLPLALAPTMNVYASAESWKRAIWRKNVDAQILLALRNIRPMAKVRYPARHKEINEAMHGAGLGATERRRVVVTRYSSREPDDIAIDIIGGKVALDRLKQCGLLVDDNRQWCQREALWRKAPPRFGYVEIEVMGV